MKTVAGKITDSTPVTIAKAASILSKFVSTDTGASQALNAYLRRATAAFDELARLHSKSDRRKHKRDSAQTQRVEASQSGLPGVVGSPSAAELPSLGQLIVNLAVHFLCPSVWAIHVSS
ncbi:hypothetical protein NC653_031560 [Populus alba x Populus x berolinensis]|uniref:Uncharacterized protein n=1 Tax=Populus alba x Populus x berolinensis TaxID=444605 RepID=A0AAD6LZ36_9ROSI|nr:hypothetical protein NC653_031560 [Populus alba x Populus x berolinensis]